MLTLSFLLVYSCTFRKNKTSLEYPIGQLLVQQFQFLCYHKFVTKFLQLVKFGQGHNVTMPQICAAVPSDIYMTAKTNTEIHIPQDVFHALKRDGMMSFVVFGKSNEYS